MIKLQEMGFSSWFRQAIQDRLDEISAQIEYHPELSRVRAEEHKAFQALFAGMDIGRMPEIAEWEDRHHFRHAVMNEWLNLQGMQDGIQLAEAFSNHSVLLDTDSPPKSEHKDSET